MIDTLRKRREEGFTLIELLIVIIILAILAAIVVFAVGSTGQNAAVSSCKADKKSVEVAVEAYKAQQGSYPPDIPTLLTTKADPNNPSVTDGPWLKEAPGTANYTISFNSTTGVVTGTLTAANGGGTC